MEKVKVSIGWSGDNYSASIEDVDGIVVVTNKSLDKIMIDAKEALDFHIQSIIEDDPSHLPKHFITGDYQLVYDFTVSAILKRIDGIITRSALSKASGVNERQIGHYIQGEKEPRDTTKNKLLKGINQIMRNLSKEIPQYHQTA